MQKEFMSNTSRVYVSWIIEPLLNFSVLCLLVNDNQNEMLAINNFFKLHELKKLFVNL
jgi:hypothetical protein